MLSVCSLRLYRWQWRPFDYKISPYKMNLFNQALFYALPVALVGIIHHFLVIRHNWFAPLARPIDLGRTFRGKRILGRSKTFRGLIIVSLGTGFFYLAFHYLFGVSSASGSLLTGMMVGFGYSVAEFPTSFVKRALGIGEGSVSISPRNIFFWADQTDSVIGSIIALRLMHNFGWNLAIIIFLIGTLLHLTGDILLHSFGYKKLREENAK